MDGLQVRRSPCHPAGQDRRGGTASEAGQAAPDPCGHLPWYLCCSPYWPIEKLHLISNFGDGILPYLTYFILICDEYFECLRRLRCWITLTGTDCEPWPMPRLSWIWTGARTALSRGQVWSAEARHHFAFCTRGTAEEVLVLLMAVSPGLIPAFGWKSVPRPKHSSRHSMYPLVN